MNPEILSKNQVEMSPLGGEYGTALQTASYHGRINIVKLLLEKGANPNTQGQSIFALVQVDGIEY